MTTGVTSCCLIRAAREPRRGIRVVWQRGTTVRKLLRAKRLLFAGVPGPGSGELGVVLREPGVDEPSKARGLLQ